MKIEERTEELLKPIIENESQIPDEDGNISFYEIVDVEYVREGSDWYLRAYIDKEGGIKINDCERISRALEAVLDQEDFIKDAYILEVSSPGLTRALKKDRDFERNMNKPVEVHLFQPMEFLIPGEFDKKGRQKTEKVKTLIGDLKEYTSETLTVDVGDEKEELVTIARKAIATVKQYFEW